MTAGTGTTALISLLYAVWAGRVLGRDEYADFAAGVALSSLLCLALGPINQTVARFAAQYSARQAYGQVRTLCWEVSRRVGKVGLIGLFASAALLQPVASLLQFRSVWTLAACFCLVYLTLMLSVPRGILRGVQRYGLYNVNVVFEALVRIGVGAVLLALAAHSAVGVAAYVIAVGATLALSWGQLRGVWSGHAAQSVDGSAIRRFAGPMFLLAFGAGGFLYVDMLFVKHFFSRTDAGLYGAASTLANSISVVVTPFHIILLPLLASMQERGGHIAGTFLRVFAYLGVMATGVILVFALWPEWIMVSLYGAEYARGAPLLAWITGARLVTHLGGLMTTVPVARSDFRFLWVYLGGLAVEIAALLVWHTTPWDLVYAMLGAQLLTVVVLTCFLFSRRKVANR